MLERPFLIFGNDTNFIRMLSNMLPKYIGDCSVISLMATDNPKNFYISCNSSVKKYKYCTCTFNQNLVNIFLKNFKNLKKIKQKIFYAKLVKIKLIMILIY